MEMQNASTAPNKSNQLQNVNTVRGESIVDTGILYKSMKFPFSRISYDILEHDQCSDTLYCLDITLTRNLITKLNLISRVGMEAHDHQNMQFF